VPPDQASLTRSRESFHGGTAQGTDVRGYTRQDSTSSDRSPPRWNDRDRRSRSPLPRGLSLGPHRLTHASGFVRELRATIQGKLQITGSGHGHRGVHDPIGHIIQTGIEAGTGQAIL
jgi:hypothetical protein